MWIQLLLLAAAAEATVSVAAIAPPSITFVSSSRKTSFGKPLASQRLQLRGGAFDDEYDDDEYDSEYDSEVDTPPPVIKTSRKSKLAASAVSASAKKSTQRTVASKSKVNAAIAKSSPVVTKKKGRNLYKRTVPYIIRACLNPFTLVAMTKSYFASLFDINYLQEDSSQNLRSALEEKARTDAAGGSNKPKRKFKPGQAKTLSDLPQLSA